MSIFNKCKHQWQIIVNEYEKSPASKMEENYCKIKTTSTPLDFFQGKRIIILQCTKCGKLNKTIEKV